MRTRTRRPVDNETARPAFRAALVVTAFAAALFHPPTAAPAEQVSCARVIGAALDSGAAPTVTYNKAWGIVHATLGELHCREPIEEWRLRGLEWAMEETTGNEAPPYLRALSGTDDTPPPAASKAKPQPKPTPAPIPKPPIPKPTATPAPPAPVPVAETPVSPSIVSAPPPPPPSAQPVVQTVSGPPPGGKCDLALDKMWRSGWHRIDDRPHWLSRAFTVDDDNDGFTDDVGLVLVDKDGKELALHYLAETGGVRGAAIGSLALPSNAVIPRLCFGTATFDEPESATPPPTASGLTIRPDLAGEMQAKQEGRPYVAPGDTDADEDGNAADGEDGLGLFTWLLLGFGGLVLIAGSLLVFLRTKDEIEEDEDFDDDDETV